MADKRLLIKLAADVDQLKAGMKQAKNSVDEFKKQVKGVGLEIASAFGVTAGVSTFINILKSGVSKIADFEAEMSKVKAVTNASDGDFKRLKESALQLSASLGVPTKAVAQLQTEYARLGFSTSEILNSTKAATNTSPAPFALLDITPAPACESGTPAAVCGPVAVCPPRKSRKGCRLLRVVVAWPKTDTAPARRALLRVTVADRADASALVVQEAGRHDRRSVCSPVPLEWYGPVHRVRRTHRVRRVRQGGA
jgi:hypothetical protein